MILTDIFNVLLLIAIALIFARVLGYIFDRLHQPVVIGEILAGFLVGSFGLGMLSEKSFSILNWTIELPQIDFTSPDFKIFADIGILFLLFISGLQTDITKLKKMGKASTFSAIGGVILPLLLGLITGLYFGYSMVVAVVIGLILVATSVGVTVRTLMNLNALDTTSGITILGAAVIDDVIGIILLAFLLGIDSPLYLSIKIAIYFLLFGYLGLKIIDKILNLGEKIQLPKALLSISLAILLIYAFFADKCGITGIIGGFIAGLLIGNTVIGSRRITEDIKVIGEGFFIPLFFVWVGAIVDLKAFLSIGFFAIMIIIMGIIGKIIGCSIGAKLAGMTNYESLNIGIGMIPRLEMAIVTATVAISHEIITGDVASHILATTILVCIITALITPFMIKAVTDKNRK